MVKIKTCPFRLLCPLLFLCGFQNDLQALKDTLDGKGKKQNTSGYIVLCCFFVVRKMTRGFRKTLCMLKGKRYNTSGYFAFFCSFVVRKMTGGL